MSIWCSVGEPVPASSESRFTFTDARPWLSRDLLVDVAFGPNDGEPIRIGFFSEDMHVDRVAYLAIADAALIYEKLGKAIARETADMEAVS